MTVALSYSHMVQSPISCRPFVSQLTPATTRGLGLDGHMVRCMKLFDGLSDGLSAALACTIRPGRTHIRNNSTCSLTLGSWRTCLDMVGIQTFAL